MFIRHPDLDERQFHEIDRQMQPMLGTLRARSLHRRTIDHEESQVTLEQRFRRVAHHPAQQRLPPRHTGLQAVVERRIADPFLSQREVPCDFAQYLVNPAVTHHHLHQLLRGFDLA